MESYTYLNGLNNDWYNNF